MLGGPQSEFGLSVGGRRRALGERRLVLVVSRLTRRSVAIRGHRHACARRRTVCTTRSMVGIKTARYRRGCFGLVRCAVEEQVEVGRGEDSSLACSGSVGEKTG
jgi:hypothetical protein